MNRYLLFPLIMLLMTFNAHAASGQSALQIVKSVQNGVKAKSVYQVMAHFTSDWVLEKQYESSKSSYTYDEYKEFIAKVMQVMHNYHYKIVKSGPLEDNGENTYAMQLTLQEMYFIGKKYLEERHDQTWYFAEESGTLKVFAIEVHN